MLLTVALAAAASGNLAGYAIGRWGGRRLLERIASAARLAKMEDLFQRRGGVVVGFGRFVDGLRQLAGIAAGSLDMGFATFFAWNLAGAIAWVTFWGAGTYLFDRDFARLSLLVHRFRPLALALAVAGVLLAIRWLRREAPPDPPATPAPPG